MNRCPFCFRQPSVRFVPVGCVGLWEVGCDRDLPGVCRQPNMEMAAAEWNEVVSQTKEVSHAA